MDILLETERLSLIRTRTSDITDLIRLWTDPVITEFLGGPRNPETIRPLFEESVGDKQDFDLWPVIEKESGDFAGHCGLLEKVIEGVSEVEVIYIIARDKQGRGYATEAGRSLIDFGFSRFGLGRIVALIEPENVLSEVVARRMGLRFEKCIIRQSGERKLFSRAKEQ